MWHDLGEIDACEKDSVGTRSMNLSDENAHKSSFLKKTYPSAEANSYCFHPDNET